MYDIALAITTLAYVAVTLWYLRSGYCSVYHPFALYLVFHGFLFTFRPIVARVMDYRAVYRIYEFTPTEMEKTQAIAIATVGLLSYAFFCFRQGNVAMHFHIDRVSLAERRLLTLPFLGVAAICAVIGLYSLTKTWHGGSTDVSNAGMVIDKATRLPINVSGNGYVLEAQLMLASCGAVLAWLFRFRLLALLPIAGFALLRASTGGRGPIVAALALLALLWLYEQRRKLPTLPILLGAMMTIAAFIAVGQDRGLAIRQWLGTDKSAERTQTPANSVSPLEGMDFADLEYLEYVVYMVPQRTHTYSWFTEELRLFTEPVPRAWWRNKPVGSPIQLYNPFDYGNPVGLTIPLPAVAWAGAGWPGVVFWCGLWGYVLGYVYRKFATGSQSTFQTIAYFTLLSSLIVGFRDGVLLTIAKQNLFFMAPIVLWLGFARLLGIPSAARIRHLLALQAARPLGANADRPARRDQPQPSLPPAVMRRRIALAAATESSASTVPSSG